MLTLTRIIFALTIIPAVLLFVLLLYILVLSKCLFTLSWEPLHKVTTNLGKFSQNIANYNSARESVKKSN